MAPPDYWTRYTSRLRLASSTTSEELIWLLYALARVSIESYVTFWKKSARSPSLPAFLPNSASTSGFPSCAATSACTLIHRRAKRSLCSSSALRQHQGRLAEPAQGVWVLIKLGSRDACRSTSLQKASLHVLKSLSTCYVPCIICVVSSVKQSIELVECAALQSFAGTWGSTCRARGACRRSRGGGSRSCARSRSPG